MVSTNQDFLNKIENILEKRNAKVTTFRYPFNSILVDVTKREKFVHSLSFEVNCNKPQTVCNMKGDLPVESKLEINTVSELKKLDCEINSIHRWKPTKEFPLRESHIHFACDNKNRTDTIKIIDMLKNY